MLAILALAACAPAPSRAPGATPGEEPRPPADAQRYSIVPGDAWLQLRLYRDGPLASLGHNHVISASTAEGYVYLGEDATSARLELTIPATALEVDRPELRAAAGEDFATELDAEAVAGTRANMLGERLLDAARFPEIRVRSREIAGRLPELRMTLAVTVRGQEHLIDVPVTVTRDGSRLVAEGQFELRHADIGLTPFSVMLGALAVRETMDVSFRLAAEAD